MKDIFVEYLDMVVELLIIINVINAFALLKDYLI